jgi:UDP-glucose 4-epimerase
MKNKKTILITGGSGFLGKRLLKKLATKKRKYNIFAQRIDLLNIKELKNSINKIKPHIVFHLAANVDLRRSYEVAKKCIDINITGTLNLLEALRQNPPEKLIFSSTEEVYGDGLIPFKENQTPQPPSPYSISKLASEDLCKLYAKELGFYLYIFRIATFYGPGSALNRFIPQIIVKALKNKEILLNSGRKKRDYIYVDDVIDAFMLAIDKKNKNQVELLNLGGGISYTLKYLVDKILKLTKSYSLVTLNAIPERLLEADEWLLSIAEAKKVLGWKPTTSLEQGLLKTVEFFKKNYL